MRDKKNGGKKYFRKTHDKILTKTGDPTNAGATGDGGGQKKKKPQQKKNPQDGK